MCSYYRDFFWMQVNKKMTIAQLHIYISTWRTIVLVAKHLSSGSQKDHKHVYNICVNILWRNRPMRELIKIRNLKERDCATVAERCRVLPLLPSPRFAPHRALLGCALTLDGATVKKDHLTSVTSRATIHGAAFSACRIPAFIGEIEGSAAPVEYGSRVWAVWRQKL
jgi:hypothetical protein